MGIGRLLAVAAAQVGLPLGEHLVVGAPAAIDRPQELRVVVGSDRAGTLVLGEARTRPPLAAAAQR